MKLPGHLIDEVRNHAESAYPEECCGVVVASRQSPDQLLRVLRCHNGQNRLHALDPTAFPRTNRNAYAIDPMDLLEIARQCREHDECIGLIYHSHPDAEVYFSEEDQRWAIVDGEPLHPGVRYLVVSVVNGKAEDLGLFSWNFDSKTYERSGENVV